MTDERALLTLLQFADGLLPTWAQVLGNLNPLFHCVQLVRHAVFGFHGLADLGHLAFLVGFALVAWRAGASATSTGRSTVPWRVSAAT